MTNEYPIHTWLDCIDAFKEPDGQWNDCPRCGLKPKVWLFNNGRSTACGCWKSTYDHWSVHAESIMSHHNRHEGNVIDYDSDGLRKNWNHWCETGEILFEHAGNRTDGRW